MSIIKLGIARQNFLLAIICCHHRAKHTDVIREYWVPDVKDKFDYKFFYGSGTHDPIKSDEVIMSGDDAYRGLASKIRNTCIWALEHGYDGLVKVDDDTAWIANRIAKAVKNDWSKYDYIGRRNGPTDKYHTCNYARGGTGYYLSKRAMQILADAPEPNPDDPKDFAEDSFVGRHMIEAGIECGNDERLRCADFSGPNRGPRPQGSTTWKRDCPTLQNDVIAVCEFLGPEMRGPYEEWTNSCEQHKSIMERIRV